MRRLKPVNTGSQKHVTEMLKNAEKNPRPSGDLIPCNMQSRHVPEEPQQLGSVIFSASNLYLTTDFSPARVFFRKSYPTSRPVARDFERGVLFDQK